MTEREISYSIYRDRVLPDQMDHARRKYQAMLRESVRRGRTELLTPEEINLVLAEAPNLR